MIPKLQVQINPQLQGQVIPHQAINTIKKQWRFCFDKKSYKRSESVVQKGGCDGVI